jgi:serine/threonine-protein kinase
MSPSFSQAAAAPTGLVDRVGRGPRETGERFGDYILLRRIGQGGMGEVFVARGAGDAGGVCALKRVLPSRTWQGQAIRRFRVESQIASLLHHPSICRLLDAGHVDGWHYLAFEYVPGPDLATVLRRLHWLGRCMPLSLAMYLSTRLCAALHHAHLQTDRRGWPLGIVHRDCSPHNVLFSYRGDIKLTDFGVAHTTDEEMLGSPLSGVVGKPGYISPEQLIGSPVDPRSDVFAVGAILYECTTGRRPLPEQHPFAMLQRLQRGQIAAPRQLDASLPVALEEIILSALSYRPEQRPQSCAEMAAALAPLSDAQFGAREAGAWLRRTFPCTATNSGPDEQVTFDGEQGTAVAIGR